MITISAPAKINLTLEVLSRRPDGFHEVRSIMQAISLSDILVIKKANKLEITSDDVTWDGQMSLVSKVANLLRERTGTRKGASIVVQKHIPLLCGLGGDSSDAAAALIGLNELWSLGLSRDELKKMASELGSDIVFFFYGGTALATGRGELITPLPPVPHYWIVLIIPDTHRLPGKTKAAYQSLNSSHFSDGKNTNKFIDCLVSQVVLGSTLLVNTFEKVAFSLHPGLETVERQLQDSGVTGIHLAGSGPTLFVLYSDQQEARCAISKLAGLNYKYYLTETI
jgi:4-diphosphocytidyl-2-C-methyl-D-erythritol kinase